MNNITSSSLQTIITWHAVTIFTSTNHSDWGCSTMCSPRGVSLVTSAKIKMTNTSPATYPLWFVKTPYPRGYQHQDELNESAATLVETLIIIMVLGYLSNSTTRPPLPPNDNTDPTHNRHDIQAQRADDYAKTLTLEVMEEIK